MKKVHPTRFIPSQRIHTLQSEHLVQNKSSKITNKLFSCADFYQSTPKLKICTDPTNKYNQKDIKQFSLQKFLLRNVLQSSQHKRFQILYDLTKNEKKPVKSSRNNQKKMIKLRTESKQNHFQSINSQRKKNNFYFESLRPSFSTIFRQNKLINDWFSQTKRPMIKLSHKQSQILKSSFNKRIKEIKLKKYFQKDQPQSNQSKLFQAYGASQKGQKHPENQDSIFFSSQIYVLCDGHGKNGKQISTLVSQIVHNQLFQSLRQNKIDETIIFETFRKIDLQLENSTFDISYSGCTCVAVLRYENTLYCISLGDSRAILCKGFNVIEISKTQKPDNPNEKQRIQNYGGVVRPIQISKDKFVGPMRIWAPGKNSTGPGLALSRAFGDKAARKYGVISIPEVNHIKLTSDQQFIIIGSDGLFDFFQDLEIYQLIRKLLKDEEIAKEQIPKQVVKEAKRKWAQDSDDISCIIIFM